MTAEDSGNTTSESLQASDPQEERDAHAEHKAGRGPTPAEERAADQSAAKVPDSVAEHYEEMTDIGANVKGEGQIMPDSEFTRDVLAAQLTFQGRWRCPAESHGTEREASPSSIDVAT